MAAFITYTLVNNALVLCSADYVSLSVRSSVFMARKRVHQTLFIIVAPIRDEILTD